MPNFKKLNYRGFTLIELLVVISLIGILSGVLITVINPQGLRAKARDSQRKSDLKQIQTALELYYADNRKYPTLGSATMALNWTRITGMDFTTPDYVSTALVTGGYINNMPIPPNSTASLTNNGPCGFNTGAPENNNRYNYTATQTGTKYTLTALMESTSSDDESKCIELTNWSAEPHCTNPSPNTWGDSTTDVCYGVQNP